MFPVVWLVLRLIHQLFPDQLSVHTSVVLQQLLVGARLHHLASINDDDPVSVFDGAQAMGYDDYSSSFEVPVESLLDLWNHPVVVQET